MHKPFILVGHSYGGDLARLFAYRYPEMIKALVLIEPSNEDRWREIPGLQRQWASIGSACWADEVKARMSWYLVYPPPAETYDPNVRATEETLNAEPKSQRAICEESNIILTSGPKQIASARALSPLPLTIVSAGKNIFADDAALPNKANAGVLWKDFDVALLGLSTRSQLRVANNSGHFVPHDEPELIIEIVRRLIQ